MRNLLLLLTLLLLMSPALGQAKTCEEYVLTATVIDRAGKVVPGMEMGDFRVKIEGKLAQVISVVPARRPRVVLLLDTSGSMLESPQKWATTLGLTSHLLRALPKEVPVGLMLFATKVEQQIVPTLDRGALEALIDAMPREKKAFAKGLRKTATFDAVHAAVAILSAEPGGVIVLISDELFDNASRTKDKHVKQELIATNTRVFAAVIDPGAVYVSHVVSYGGPPVYVNIGDPTAPFYAPVGKPFPERGYYGSHPEYKAELAAFVARSGGALLEVPVLNPREQADKLLPEVARQLGTMAVTGYELRIAPPRPVLKPARSRIEAVDKRGKVRNDVHVFAPRVIDPCVPPKH